MTICTVGLLPAFHYQMNVTWVTANWAKFVLVMEMRVEIEMGKWALFASLWNSVFFFSNKHKVFHRIGCEMLSTPQKFVPCSICQILISVKTSTYVTFILNVFVQTFDFFMIVIHMMCLYSYHYFLWIKLQNGVHQGIIWF